MKATSGSLKLDSAWFHTPDGVGRFCRVRVAGRRHGDEGMRGTQGVGNVTFDRLVLKFLVTLKTHRQAGEMARHPSGWLFVATVVACNRKVHGTGRQHEAAPSMCGDGG